jgi:hypothetical protein
VRNSLPRCVFKRCIILASNQGWDFVPARVIGRDRWLGQAHRGGENLSFNWSPGIGDPTFIGWLTVTLYFAASISCWRSGQMVGLHGRRRSHERRAWRFIAMLFLVLGINKQLDLQTALTEAGRVLAHLQGWYEQRRIVQTAFIGLVTITCLLLAATLLAWMRRAPVSTWLALLGTITVLGFVLIRAASFEHIDRLIGESILGLRWHWVIEISGISLVLVSSQWRQIP